MNYYSLFVERPGTVHLIDADRVKISNIMHMCIFYIYMERRIEISALGRPKKKPHLYKPKKKLAQKRHEIISGSPWTIVKL